jgi:alkylation response protein AidB-like acyl-CoA dehydrogenase
VSSGEAVPPASPAGGAVAIARRLADELLWPAAQEIDRARSVPRAVLDALAGAGLYGLLGPPEMGGLGAGPKVTNAVFEALGGGSLATAFVWAQHQTTVRAVAESSNELRREWLPALCSGRMRSGIAVAALRRPGPPAMVAEPDGDGVVLRGFAPWVTGWGLIDVVLVAARVGNDVVWVLVDANAGPATQVDRLSLAAVDSSATVKLRMDGLVVPASRVVGRQLYSEWRAREAPGLARSGFLAIGVAQRCVRLLGDKAGELGRMVDRARRRLFAVDGRSVVPARVEASLIAVRAATALVAAGGGRSVEVDQPAQRLAREAMFLLVFAQTEEIRSALLKDLTGETQPPVTPAPF